jgi:hypothetical protein
VTNSYAGLWAESALSGLGPVDGQKIPQKGLHRAELEYFFARLSRKTILYLAFILTFVYSYHAFRREGDFFAVFLQR